MGNGADGNELHQVEDRINRRWEVHELMHLAIGREDLDRGEGWSIRSQPQLFHLNPRNHDQDLLLASLSVEAEITSRKVAFA